MTPEQIRLARVALGLPNDRGQSYQNTYFAPRDPASADAEWEAMADAGLALRGARMNMGRFYTLTRGGAEKALLPGERLNAADFPPIGAH